MTLRRMLSILLLVGLPAWAKDVTCRLAGVEPLTFTIPDDWSSGWSPIMSFQNDDPEAPVDLIGFHKPPPPDAPPRDHLEPDPGPTLLLTAAATLVPLENIQAQMLYLDMENQTIATAKEIRQPSTGQIIGYYNRAPSRRPGSCQVNAFWNLGSRTWNADIFHPADQPDCLETCLAILESVRLADPDTAPPTPRRPVTDGVEDAEFPEEFMNEWRSHHGIP